MCAVTPAPGWSPGPLAAAHRRRLSRVAVETAVAPGRALSHREAGKELLVTEHTANHATETHTERTRRRSCPRPVAPVTPPVVDAAVLVGCGVANAYGLLRLRRDSDDVGHVVCQVCGSENPATQPYCRSCRTDLGGGTGHPVDA